MIEPETTTNATFLLWFPVRKKYSMASLIQEVQQWLVEHSLTDLLEPLRVAGVRCLRDLAYVQVDEDPEFCGCTRVLRRRFKEAAGTLIQQSLICIHPCVSD
jgi:hypothetical protein